MELSQGDSKLLPNGQKKKSVALKQLISHPFLSKAGDQPESGKTSHEILNTLRVLSIGRYGLVSNEMRLKVWPMLAQSLCYDAESQSGDCAKSDFATIPKLDVNKLESYKDYQQVLMDVNRSLKRFPPGLDEVERMSMQDQLVSLILRVLNANKQLYYYQGFHDIAVTFLIVLGEDVAAAVLFRISQYHLKDFMGPNMDPTIRILHLLPAILKKVRPELAQSLSKVGLEPFYALPWVITWFGHVLGDLPRILRLYDFFMASHPLMPIYLSAAIVLHRTEELMQMTGSEGADYALLHHSLSNLPNDLPLENLIVKSVQLYRSHPPVELWKSVPKDEDIPSLSRGGGARDSDKVITSGRVKAKQSVMRALWSTASLPVANFNSAPVRRVSVFIVIVAIFVAVSFSRFSHIIFASTSST